MTHSHMKQRNIGDNAKRMRKGRHVPTVSNPARARICFAQRKAESEADYLGPYLLQYLAEDPNPAIEKQHVCPECGGSGTTLEPTCCNAIGGCGSPSCSGSVIVKAKCRTCDGEGMVE